MRLQFTLAGVAPLIMHNLAAGLDTRSPVSREIAEIAAKKGGNRTDVDDLRLQELECQRSLYLGADGKPTLPPAALRAMIEAGARTVRQGPAGPRGTADRARGLVPLRRQAVRRDAQEARRDGAVHGAGRGAGQEHPADPGEVRLPVVGGGRGRRRQGAGGQGAVDGVAGAGRSQNRSRGLAAGEERLPRPVRRRGRDRADRRGAAARPSRRGRRAASAGKRGRARRSGAA